MPYLLKSSLQSLEQFCTDSSGYTFKTNTSTDTQGIQQDPERSRKSPYTIKSGKTSIKLSTHNDFPNHYILGDDAWDMLEDFDDYCVDKQKG